MPACASGALGVLLHAEKITPNAMPTLQRILLPLFLMTLVASLASCAIFRLPTIQGNVIEQKQVDQLEIGMTPDQVRFLLGTPLVQGSFDPNRWDYVYYYRSPGGQEVQRSLNLYFENDKLARIVGQDDPSATGDASTPTTAPEERPVDDTPLPDSSVSPGSDEEDSPIPKP
jgi:outer membrane protein assembly factor BamE